MNPELSPVEPTNKKSNGKWIVVAIIACLVLFGCIATLLIVKQNTARTTSPEQKVATVVLSNNGFFPESIDLTENRKLSIENQTSDTAALFVAPSIDDSDSDRYVVTGEQYTITFNAKGKFTVSAGKTDPKQLIVNVK